MRVAILGTGGVGGYLGAKLWQSGHDVTFVARGAHLAAMQQRGMKLESPEGNIRVNSTFTDSLIGQLPVDLIIVAVKSYDTPSAVDIIRPVVKETTAVLTIQNGVENEHLLSEGLGKRCILAGVAYMFSTIAEPGVIRHHGGTTKFKLGETDGRMSDRCRDLERALNNAGIDAESLENIERVLWEKWIFICGLGGMTAFSRKAIGDILSDVTLTEMLQEVVHEASSIARFRRVDEFAGLEQRLLERYHKLPPTHTSSMYYDVTRKKRLEVEALNGAVVRFGKEAHLSTPANDKVYQTLKSFG